MVEKQTMLELFPQQLNPRWNSRSPHMGLNCWRPFEDQLAGLNLKKMLPAGVFPKTSAAHCFHHLWGCFCIIVMQFKHLSKSEQAITVHVVV